MPDNGSHDVWLGLRGLAHFEGRGRSGAPGKGNHVHVSRGLTNHLRDSYTREKLEAIMLEILEFPAMPGERAPTKASFVEQYTSSMSLPELARLAGRIIAEVNNAPDLQSLLDIYVAGGGVSGTPKNLIFAADGPKPEIVFTDAIDNNIAITKNADRCLVDDRSIGAAGLTYQDLVTWWKEGHPEAGEDDLAVGKQLHARFSASLPPSGTSLEMRGLFPTVDPGHRLVGR